MDEITGKTLLAWGYKPGGWFGAAIAAAEQARRAGAGEARSAPPSTGTSPPLPRRCVPRVRWPIG